ncbi:hypothetical protein As57867_019037, partial [Aphanomyces stellatus]
MGDGGGGDGKFKIKRRHYEIAVGLVLLAGAIVGVLFGAGVFAQSDTVKAQKAFEKAVAALPPRDPACPTVVPGKRVVEYFASQRVGCASVPSGVTHVVLTYADLSTQSFQMTDLDTLACVGELRKRCISVVGGLGGSKPFDIAMVATQAAALVQKFKLDGVAVHDLTSTASTLPYMTALSASLKPLRATLSYDVFYTELDTDDGANCGGMRCFTDGVDALVDWVSVMVFSVSNDPVLAASIYDGAVSGFLAMWQKKLPPAKFNLGLCVDCGYGPGPSPAAIAAMASVARAAGGVSVHGSSNTPIQSILQALATPPPSNTTTNATTTSSSGSKCGAPPTTGRVVAYWGSEVDGCTTLPRGVTHVIFSFALLKQGLVTPSMQGSDATLRSCVQALHARCVQVLGALGGATNDAEMAALTNMTAMA